VTCQRCQALVADGSRFCPACGQLITDPDSATGVAAASDTPTHSPSEAPTVAAAPKTPSGGGWLTSSGSIDHGRFAPGAVLDGRYRIAGLLGRGGMGEVFRADDLRLGQTVALKFLPPDLGRDPDRLAQFHNEVRTARQVSHPNVCRVYDIGEIDHQIYLSMEYVDGEDLASLLRRIGRLPEDKAVEIARQICAGLAAAHERGVIHRDLKPANIMLDGSGRARVMDFSLAAVGEVTDVRSGTPSYMAPEQLAGREVTTKSDLYSLGLVLYELFTGRRAYDAKTLGELVAQHESGSLTAPTSLVKTLDPVIERAILRCLETDPARRPATALVVAASLPGGDPLAAALAAGETPSPAMVAAVGGDAATVSPLGGMLWFGAAAAILVAAGALSDRVSILSRTPFPKPAAVLADRAEVIRQSLGYTEPPADHASGFAFDTNYLTWAEQQGAGRTHWTVLQSGRPAPIRFWYRTSPGALVPMQPHGSILPTDPPLAIADMTEVDIDALGRLQAFQAVPPAVESTGTTGSPHAVDWTPLFAAAALDPKAFADVAPTRTPPTFADDRRAWQGPLPGTDTTVRVEAAAYRGRPVYFLLVGPWTASRDVHTTAGSQQDSTFNVVLVLLLLFIAAVLARANLRSGHADRRGAIRLAVFAVFVQTAIWAALDHVRDISAERTRLFDGVANALFVGGAMFLIYLALEPYVRRSWPTVLIGWSRLLGGQLRDPLVGRDLLIGTAAGAICAATSLGFLALPLIHRGVEAPPALPDLEMLSGLRHWLFSTLASVNSGFQNALFNVLILVLLRHVVRAVAGRLGRRGVGIDNVATAFAVAVWVILAAINPDGDWSDGVFQALTAALELLVILRVGLLAACVMFFVIFYLQRVPMTLDPGRFYATDAWMSMALVLAIAAIGFWLARADEPLFGRSSTA
jgi:hypothetical protein